MYKVFVNDCVLILTDVQPSDTKALIFGSDTKSIHNAITTLVAKENTTAFIVGNDKDKLLQKIKKTIPVVVAAGGKVRNKRNNKILFIYRNNKWDLPKGKLDRGETMKLAAIREIEEETGVTHLKIERFLAKTYHIFKRSGNYKLKETYWYEMSTKFSGELVGQKEEGITKVKWKGPRKTRKALKNSYANIQLLFELEKKEKKKKKRKKEKKK